MHIASRNPRTMHSTAAPKPATRPVDGAIPARNKPSESNPTSQPHHGPSDATPGLISTSPPVQEPASNCSTSEDSWRQGAPRSAEPSTAWATTSLGRATTTMFAFREAPPARFPHAPANVQCRSLPATRLVFQTPMLFELRRYLLFGGAACKGPRYRSQSFGACLGVWSHEDAGKHHQCGAQLVLCKSCVASRADPHPKQIPPT